MKYENLGRESIKESDSTTDYKEEDKIGRIGGHCLEDIFFRTGHDHQRMIKDWGVGCHCLWKIYLLGQDMIINV